MGVLLGMSPEPSNSHLAQTIFDLAFEFVFEQALRVGVGVEFSALTRIMAVGLISMGSFCRTFGYHVDDIMRRGGRGMRVICVVFM